MLIDHAMMFETHHVNTAYNAHADAHDLLQNMLAPHMEVCAAYELQRL
jgi:hypothetical protein